MTLPIDCDLLGFLWTTAKVVLGSKPQLRKNTRPIPLRYQRERPCPKHRNNILCHWMRNSKH